MKWDQSTASKCRYSNVATRILENADILIDNSVDDYQGRVDLIAFMPNSDIITFTYSYGSCSGCDDWEDRRLSESQIEEEMRRDCMEIFTDYEEFKKYLDAVNLFDEISKENVIRFLVSVGEKGILLQKE